MTTHKKFFSLLTILFAFTTAISQTNSCVSPPVLFLDTIYKKLDSFYARPLPDFIIRKSVDAMMTSLDPHTRYLDKAEADEFRLSVTAKYGGLGLSTLVVDGEVTIAEVYSGFPADKGGLIPGDVIKEVNGVATRGDMNATIDKLRGTPGTGIKLSIARPGASQPLTVKLVREEIRLRSVPYYGVLKNNIGYIAITGITSNVSEEVKAALTELQKQPLEGLILDLRENMGGALVQAVKTANLFIEKGKPIVSVKGRIQDTTYYADEPAMNSSLPIVVLISNVTASSAEVLTGAMQDYDRAVIMGQPSYGKGLVQNMYNTGNGTLALITTGHYYTPSGRCIQLVDYAGLGGDNKKVADSLQKEFRTSSGRTVKSGMGVTPDVATTPMKRNPVIDCLTPQLLFKYAMKYKETHPSIGSPLAFELEASEVDAFLRQPELTNCRPSLETTKKLAALKQSAEAENIVGMNAYIAHIEMEMDAFRTRMVVNSRTFIKWRMEREIAKLYYKQAGAFATGIKYDAEITRAIEVLSQPDFYRNILRAK